MTYADMHGSIVLHGEDADAMRRFAEVWSDGELHDAIGTQVTCHEVDALAGVLKALGVADEAIDWLIHCHAQGDDEGDLHHQSTESV